MFAIGRAIAACFLAGPLLAACAAAQLLEPPSPGDQAAPSYPEPAPAPAPAPPPIAPPPAPAAPAIFDEAALRAEYGVPDFIRKESDPELWRYDGANCALFLFLYRENESYLLRYRETLPRGADDPADVTCVNSIKARAAPAS